MGVRINYILVQIPCKVCGKTNPILDLSIYEPQRYLGNSNDACSESDCNNLTLYTPNGSKYYIKSSLIVFIFIYKIRWQKTNLQSYVSPMYP